MTDTPKELTIDCINAIRDDYFVHSSTEALWIRKLTDSLLATMQHNSSLKTEIDFLDEQLQQALSREQKLREALEAAKWALHSTVILRGYSKGDEGVAELVHYVRQIEEVITPAMKAIETVLADHPNE